MMLSVAFGAQPTADGLARFAARGGSAAAPSRRCPPCPCCRPRRADARAQTRARAKKKNACARASPPPRSERVGVRTPELSRERERLAAFAEALFAFPRGDPAFVLRARDIDVCF